LPSAQLAEKPSVDASTQSWWLPCRRRYFESKDTLEHIVEMVKRLMATKGMSSS
jgi:hypothetical protein